MNHYKNILPAVEALSADDVKKPNMPVAIFLQEVSDLMVWIKKDRQALLDVGVETSLLDDLETRMEALEDAESNWNHFRNSKSEKEKAFKAKRDEAQELRRELLLSFRFAYRGHDDLLAGVRRTAKGNSIADLVQDLMDLSVSGQAHKELLKNINFDMKLLDTASSLCSELSISNGMYRAEERDRMTLLDLRNRFYTYLYLAVSEIREAGKYAFRNDPDRAEGYKSSYFKAHNKR